MSPGKSGSSCPESQMGSAQNRATGLCLTWPTVKEPSYQCAALHGRQNKRREEAWVLDTVLGVHLPWDPRGLNLEFIQHLATLGVFCYLLLATKPNPIQARSDFGAMLAIFYLTSWLGLPVLSVLPSISFNIYGAHQLACSHQLSCLHTGDQYPFVTTMTKFN